VVVNLLEIRTNTRLSSVVTHRAEPEPHGARTALPNDRPADRPTVRTWWVGIAGPAEKSVTKAVSSLIVGTERRKKHRSAEELQEGTQRKLPVEPPLAQRPPQPQISYVWGNKGI